MVNGPVTIDVPRDRNGSFGPAIVPKKTRRLGNINSVVLSLYSHGMTTRDIEAHLAEVYGATVSRELISNVTEVVVDEIKALQSRPLDEVYPILYIDGLRLRIRDNGVVGADPGCTVARTPCCASCTSSQASLLCTDIEPGQMRQCTTRGGSREAVEVANCHSR